MGRTRASESKPLSEALNCLARGGHHWNTTTITWPVKGHSSGHMTEFSFSREISRLGIDMRDYSFSCYSSCRSFYGQLRSPLWRHKDVVHLEGKANKMSPFQGLLSTADDLFQEVCHWPHQCKQDGSFCVSRNVFYGMWTWRHHDVRDGRGKS